MSGSSVNFLFKRFQPFPDPVEFRRIPEYHDSHIPVVPLQRRKPVLNWHKPEASGTRDRSELARKDRTSPYVSQLALADPGRLERPPESVLEPAWQRHSNDANSGQGLVFPAGGSIPHEELLLSPKGPLG
jgi:hypothetical protein